MIEFAVFTPEVAMNLITRGFKLIRRNEVAWFFEDSVLLEAAVSELVAALEDNGS